MFASAVCYLSPAEGRHSAVRDCCNYNSLSITIVQTLTLARISLITTAFPASLIAKISLELSFNSLVPATSVESPHPASRCTWQYGECCDLNPVFVNVVWTSTLTRIFPGFHRKHFILSSNLFASGGDCVMSVASAECRHPVSDPCTWQRRHGCKCMGQDRWMD